MNYQKILALLTGGVLILSLFSGCGQDTNQEEAVPDYPVEISGTKVLEMPTGVVSLSPSITQTLEELGLGGRIIGISEYCEKPDTGGETFRFQRCGTAQNPDLAAIRRTGAKVVFAPDTLTNENIIKIQQMDMDVIVIPSPASLEEVKTICTDLFRVMWGENEGVVRAGVWSAKFDQKLEDIRSRVAQAETGLSAVYVGPALLNIATGDTLEGQVLELLGLENWGAPYTDFVYPKEKEVELMPEVLFYNQLLTGDYIKSSSCYKTTPAVQNGKVFAVEASDFENRAPDSLLGAIWEMGEWLYPDAFYQEPQPDRGY